MSSTDGETRIRVETVSAGLLWFIGWLFTIGYAQLSLGQAIIALIGWPYFLGVVLR